MVYKGFLGVFVSSPKAYMPPPSLPAFTAAMTALVVSVRGEWSGGKPLPGDHGLRAHPYRVNAA